MRLYFIFLFTIPVFLLSCQSGSDKILQNEKIPENIQSGISSLNNDIMHALAENDLMSVSNRLSDGAKRYSFYYIDSILVRLGKVIQNPNAEIFDEFYIESDVIHKNIVIEPEHKLSYIFRFKNQAKTTYISILNPAGFPNEILLCTIWGKYENDWNLDFITYGQYSIHGFNAIELHDKATTNFERARFFDAANEAYLSGQCLNPLHSFWHYKNEKEIRSFYVKAKTKVNEEYEFPAILDKVKTKPVVYNITVKVLDIGYFPMIEYLSKESFSDTAALNRECDAIHSIIGKYYTGIDTDKEYVLYKAFDEVPDGKKAVNTYSFYREAFQR
jgi:hypothetical protein